MTETIVEVVPQTPPAPTPPVSKAAEALAPLPGVPLAVAGANALGAVAAGAVAVGGPAGLAVTGAAMGAAAATGLAHRIAARRAKNKPKSLPAQRTPAGGRDRSSPSPSSGGGSGGHRRTSGPRSGGLLGKGPGASAAGLRAAARNLGRHRADSRSAGTQTHGTAKTAPSPGGSLKGHTSRPNTPSSRPVSSGGADKPQRRSGGGLVQAARRAAVGAAAGAIRAGHARYAAGAPARAGKVAARSARRAAKGEAKARRQSGLDPAGNPTPKAPPAAIRQKALRRSALRHAARMTGSALLAAGAGLASGVWNWKKPGVATRHMRVVWRRLAGRALQVRAARDAAINGTPTDGSKPVVAAPATQVNNPNRPKDRVLAPVGQTVKSRPVVLAGADRIGGTVSESGTAFTRLSDAAEVMLQAASTFDPEYMAEFQDLIDDLPEAMSTVQETLRVLAELSQEKLPVDPLVVEEIGEGYRAMSRVVSALDEVGTVYRRVHAGDIERIENPRNGIDGERRWNVS
ncbi:hypothetical protein OHA91_25845 [Streptomyces erythrochromogenes]|uniref:Uncharacterized protein n=1 Tax=Streptomyces erythrochromogenes TaxID=285574 RepID=A0ABZ1QG69_9ACTN|nr:hypothetical protein [Streptomyces erythrochromogenes]